MTDHTTGRRSLLLGVAGAGALAACSSPPVPSAEAPNQPPAGAPSRSAGTGTEPASEATGTASATEAPAAAGTPISEIPVGGGKIFPAQNVVVTQPVAGTLKAFSTTCTHQQCAVTSVREGFIICPCHDSAFAIDSGAPTEASEAKRPLQEKSITVSGGRFTLT
jgi:nitrite reductase/ring-hydroxylating ferredoxin subunit